MEFGFGNQLLWHFYYEEETYNFLTTIFLRLKFTAMVLNKTSGYSVCLYLKLHWHKISNPGGGLSG